MAVEKNLRVAISFYKKHCLPVVTQNKNDLSKQVIPTTYTLERRFFGVAILLKVCESFLFRQSNRTWYTLVRSSCPEVFCKKGVLKNLTKFTGKHLCQSLFLIKLQACGLWRKCFPATFVKFLRTLFYTKHLSCLLLFGLYESSFDFHRREDQINTGYEE